MDSLLEAYRVLDLADEKGMFAGEVLGGFGADVIKMEPPGGAPARNIGPFYRDIPASEKSLSWFAHNRNKRGITLNIETRDGQEIFKGLVKTAHFIIETFPPGYMDNLDLGYDVLSQINPTIIVCSITPFGQTGPYKDYKSCDLVAMATGAMLYICGDPDRPPVRCNSDLAYYQAGVQATLAMMIAHYHRRQTGEGQYIDVSLQECVTSILWHTQQHWDLNREIVTRTGKYMKREPKNMRNNFHCKDGAISWQLLTAYQGSRTRHLVEWMAEEGMASDELKAVSLEEVDYEDLTEEQLSRWEDEFARFFLTKTKAELVEQSIKRLIMIFPCNTTKDFLEDEQLASRSFWVEARHLELGDTITYPGAPLILNEVPWRMSHRAPLIGEHNEEIYVNELGFSREELVLLKEHNVI